MVTSVGLKEFNIAIDKFAKETPEQILVVKKQLMLNGLRLLVQRTPVGNPSEWKNPEGAPPGYVGGRARGNWQVTEGSPAAGVLDRIEAEEGEARAPGEAIIFAMTELFGEAWISNNLPYIEELERGHSQQTPNGMLAVTVEDLRSVFK